MCRQLREARERSGLTQVEAAAALGQPQNFVSKSETGERKINPIELADFAVLYGTTLEALVPGSPRPAAATARGGRSKRVAEPKVESKNKTGGGAGDRPGALEAGVEAPAFTLDDADGRPVSLADFAGKDVILYFYPKDDTPGCTKEACGFRDAWGQIRELGVIVLGVSADDAASHRRFADKYRLPFPLLSDPEHRVMRAYGAYREKTLYGRKILGVTRSTVWIGPDGKVRKHWPRVANAGEHPEQVLAAIRAGA
jgi:thioredoxin-dependent peroxiredoxin